MITGASLSVLARTSSLVSGSNHLLNSHNIKLLLIDHVSSVEIVLFAVMITSLWLAEKIVLAETADRKLRHSLVNALFIPSALAIQLFFALLFTSLSHWVTNHHWGIVYRLPDPSSPWIKYVLMFFLLDFLDYVYHVTMHQVALFWRFHLVHHTDLKVDVSTNLREHPGETFIRNCFLLFWIFICGASFGVLFLRQAVQTIANISSHTSFRLPSRSARVLGWVFITPNLHQVHHHFRMPHTNCNYGDVFSIWDRIFGTFSDLSEEDTVFGLDTHMDESVNGNYLGIIAMPFRKPATARGTKRRLMPQQWLTLLAIAGFISAGVPAHALNVLEAGSVSPGQRPSFLSTHVLATASSSNAASTGGQSEGARKFVDVMAKKTVTFLADKSLSEQQKKRQFRDLMFADFDMDTIGRFVLGTHWRTATPAQREEYLKLFREMIAASWADRFETYKGETFELRGAQKAESEDDTLVGSAIIPADNSEILVDWRVRFKEGHFKIVDVTVAGVSLSVTQRSDYSSVIQRGGGDVEVLLANLRQQVQ